MSLDAGVAQAGPGGSPGPADTRALLDVRQITKRFVGTLALDGVDFQVRAGEVHALLGENGAGKSTLIKILAGVYPRDHGEILIRGEAVEPGKGKLPISFIHQDLGLVDSMTVAENIAVVAGYPRRFGLIAWKANARQAAEVLDLIGSDIDPGAAVGELPAAERSMVAIARALAVKCDLLVLDEPTATLPNSEVARLFDVLHRLRKNGLGLVYVTHRLDEVFEIADRVTVLRDGRKISTRPVADVTPDQLVRDIVGHDVRAVFPPSIEPGRSVRLELKDLQVGPVGPISLQVARGEILGLVGLVGAGHHLVGRSIIGDASIERGQIILDGQVLPPLRQPRTALNHGIGFLSSKRQEESLLGSLTVQENLFPRPKLPNDDSPFLIHPHREAAQTSDVIRQFSIRPPDPQRPISSLSGGNQQKVVLSRSMLIGEKVLVLEEPTTGVDVGAKADIYDRMHQVALEGRVILIVSSDFEEVGLICHRAVIFYRGQIVGELTREQLTVERLTAIAVGAG